MVFFGNYMLGSAVYGWAAAQVVKTILYFMANRKLSLERLVGSGGMPSAHSAAISAFTAAAWLTYGAGSFEFAVSFIFAIIVMYDACSVRRAVGEHARLLNECRCILTEECVAEEKQQVLIGHTPFQVIVGSLVGVVSAVVLHN